MFEYVVRGFLLFDLFLNQVLATTSADGRVESDLPGWTSESNRPFNKPNTCGFCQALIDDLSVNFSGTPLRISLGSVVLELSHG